MPGIPDKPPFKPEQHQNPDQLWQERLKNLSPGRNFALVKTQTPIKWLASRGISAEAAGRRAPGMESR